MTATHTFKRSDLATLRRLAQELAFAVRPGDLIALHGDLGAGKTTFAREVILAMAPDTPEVPSPTFTLVQSYASPRMAIAHFDLYRLNSPDELDELGLDESLSAGFALVEWPERAAHRLPAERLDITLADCGPATSGGESGGFRTVTLAGSGAWASHLDRLVEIHAFLLANGLAPERADICYLQGDASARRYAIPVRARRAITPQILMDLPRQPDGPPIRDGKPYSRVAHLAEDVRAFVAVDGALTTAGFSAPQVFAQDLDHGLLLIEHLGNRVFGTEIGKADVQAQLWRAAVDVLVGLRRSAPPDASRSRWLRSQPSRLRSRRARHRNRASRRLVLGRDSREADPIAIAGRFRRRLERGDRSARCASDRLGAARFPFAELVWLPERDGVRNVGLIDFQDAMRGPLAYDLVSLLQDARVDVAAALESELLDHYCARLHAPEPGFDEAQFRFAYAALGAQRNTKILGIFARLSKRDGKPVYLAHMPRIWRYLARDLTHPDLAPLAAWYDRHFPPRCVPACRSLDRILS